MSESIECASWCTPVRNLAQSTPQLRHPAVNSRKRHSHRYHWKPRVDVRPTLGTPVELEFYRGMNPSTHSHSRLPTAFQPTR
ncbi:hypothetical protein T11_13361 [Trichinella zimbabwensis]|uniref:Uncharacterized protein n=1 Tax=Trichinella zimbabwensis TaxID=268475 RepID=A0A0V1GTV5_9BILA|nr:hypothetical protein T11_13145 [Trichinella zimbabwensis]KRZ10647.1 hypothetical protein T11_13361 [Trichinella zimbabwensis]